MKSLKQDLVGFHWSAFFEPRLPFTRVPVKTPSGPPPTFSPSPSPPPVSPPRLSAHLPTLQCTYCQLAMVNPYPPAPFSQPPSLVTSDPISCPLYSVTFYRHAGWPPLPLTHACIPTHLPQTSITKSIPLSICKTLRGPYFFIFLIFRGVGDNKMEGFLHSAFFLVLLSHNIHL